MEEVLEKISLRLNKILLILAGILLVCMVLLTCANIVSRQIFVPIRGAFELMGFMGAVVTAFAMGYTQIRKEHIRVDTLVRKFPESVKRWLSVFNGAVCMVFFGTVSWQVVKRAMTMMNTGEVSETLRIIYYPFTFCVAVGCGTLGFVLLIEVIRGIQGRKEEKI